MYKQNFIFFHHIKYSEYFHSLYPSFVFLNKSLSNKSLRVCFTYKNKHIGVKRSRKGIGVWFHRYNPRPFYPYLYPFINNQAFTSFSHYLSILDCYSRRSCRKNDKLCKVIKESPIFTVL